MHIRALSILCCFIFSVSFSQTHVIKGRILMDETQKPLANASVYLSNTSIGTASNDNGDFLLQYSLNGSLSLVVSSLGYQTYVQTIQADKLPQMLIIHLKYKVQDLGNVEVRSFDRDGWRKWATIFMESFIGSSVYANDCTLKNPEAIKFHFSEKKNELTAFANEQLIITNKALGYIIHYKLEKFKFNFESHFLVYTGYPLFEEIPFKKPSTQLNWKKKRAEAYYGSMLHFMRSLFKDELEKNGFEVYTIKKITDEERIRVNSIIEKLKDQNNKVFTNNDSLIYYRALVNNTDVKEIVLPFLKSRKDLFTSVDSTVGVLSFPDYLDVTYTKKSIPNEYTKYLPKASPTNVQRSRLGFANTTYVKVYADGNYYEPQNLVAEGFWSWWEKMATMLPFDYMP